MHFDGALCWALEPRGDHKWLGRYRLLNGVEHQVIEHELVGIQPLGAPAVNSPEQLFYLVLKHGDVLLGGVELLGQGFDVEFFFFEELVGLVQ